MMSNSMSPNANYLENVRTCDLNDIHSQLHCDSFERSLGHRPDGRAEHEPRAPADVRAHAVPARARPSLRARARAQRAALPRRAVEEGGEIPALVDQPMRETPAGGGTPTAPPTGAPQGEGSAIGTCQLWELAVESCRVTQTTVYSYGFTYLPTKG